MRFVAPESGSHRFCNLCSRGAPSCAWSYISLFVITLATRRACKGTSSRHFKARVHATMNALLSLNGRRLFFVRRWNPRTRKLASKTGVRGESPACGLAECFFFVRSFWGQQGRRNVCEGYGIGHTRSKNPPVLGGGSGKTRERSYKQEKKERPNDPSISAQRGYEVACSVEEPAHSGKSLGLKSAAPNCNPYRSTAAVTTHIYIFIYIYKSLLLSSLNS